jgi:hypothetical protein
MNHTSRRSFLSSLAILSAGATLAQVPGFLQTGTHDTELQELWASFWKNSGGRRVTGNLSLAEASLPLPCKGQFYKAGDPVRFENEKLIAVPAWIYWGNQQHQPADLIITFFKDGIRAKKITRINRFELEGLSAVLASGRDRKILPLLVDTSKPALAREAQKMNIKTRITKGKEAEILATVSDQAISLKKNFFFNI